MQTAATPDRINRRQLIMTGLAATATVGAASLPITAAAGPPTQRSSFRPGEPWLDTSDHVIQAHGGQVVVSADAEGEALYYWYGEDRSNGYADSPGVHVYSSSDLYTWTDEGLALRAMSSMNQFESDAYFRDLYAGYSDVERDAVFRDLGTHRIDPDVNPAILERPKVIYNADTSRWVMWVHADGPSKTSDAQYAKAKAGVAVSASPTGPFRYIDSYRLHVAPEGEPNFAPDNPGMARDMNLFVDDDGTGYIIYSSEENYSLFISRLNGDYTQLATPPDAAVKGIDFTRPYIGAHREAPALFRYRDKYYLITSGATGWDPNPARYATATDILGEWTDHGSPITGDGAEDTHRSQSTSVIPVDREDGRFIFMGDRWTPDDLANAPYVWLPITFGEGTSLSLGPPDEWSLDDLPAHSPYTVDVRLPSYVWLDGDADALPTRADVRTAGEKQRLDVDWDTAALAQPGLQDVIGTLPDGRTFHRNVLVVPRNLRYVINSGGIETDDWSMIIRIPRIRRRLLNTVPDQPLTPDPHTGVSWGYDSEGSLAAGASDGDLYSTLRYAVDHQSITYTFGDLPRGVYAVHVGYHDPWPSANRAARIAVNDTVVDDERTFSAAYTAGRYDARVSSQGTVTLTVAPTRAPDIQVSWVMIERR